MELSNLYEVLVYYLLIGWITYFGYQDEFSIVSVLMCCWDRALKSRHDVIINEIQ